MTNDSCCGKKSGRGATANGTCNGKDLTTKEVAPKTDEEKRQTIMEGYASIANDEGRSCCGKDKDKDVFAQGLGYTAENLKNLPEGANMGLSCGNPTAMASLQPGQVVLDLGCGGGFDVFIAAKAVGETGNAIGVDMTPAMIHKARRNTKKFEERTGLHGNVEFRLGEIEHLPAADNSIDVVISNCVINLSPNKQQVWNEIARVLKPGTGKACISDVALLKPIPDKVRSSISALVGCVSGAIEIDNVVRLVHQAGLVVVSADRDAAFAHKAETSDDPLYANIMKDFPDGDSPSDFITSLKLTVQKPE